ncbi:MAG: alpha/beta hydrolase [Chitinophagales bacterium]|nr:alpha/beta hydrolase [Chitinophagales bacterium]
MNWKSKLVLSLERINGTLNANKKTPILLNRMRANIVGKMGSLLFDKKLPIKKVEDFKVEDIPIRYYCDVDGKNLKTILYFHGGGFSLYGLDSHDCVCRRLAKMNNCNVFSVDYRLAPEHVFPAAHNDAKTIVNWAFKNIEKYNGNKNKIIVAGDSAGGNLAACLAHYCKKEKLPLMAQILVYPWVDGTSSFPSINQLATGYFLTKAGILYFRDTYLSNKLDYTNVEFSPYYEKDFSNLAPVFVLTAAFDPLKDEGFAYYEKLKAANNNAQYKEYKEVFHSFFNIPYIDENAMQAYTDIQLFLNQFE